MRASTDAAFIGEGGGIGTAACVMGKGGNESEERGVGFQVWVERGAAERLLCASLRQRKSAAGCRGGQEKAWRIFFFFFCAVRQMKRV